MLGDSTVNAWIAQQSVRVRDLCVSAVTSHPQHVTSARVERAVFRVYCAITSATVRMGHVICLLFFCRCLFLSSFGFQLSDEVQMVQMSEMSFELSERE
jgi:hypothetical protein